MSILEMLEGLEIRELMPNELKYLKSIIGYENLKVDYISKEDPRMPHPEPWVPDFVNPQGKNGAIIIIALGPEGISKRYPLLHFSGKTLLGFFAVNFASLKSGQVSELPYQKHEKRVLHLFADRIYIFPPFRGNIGLIIKLLNHLEDTLKKYGLGNIELKPDPFLAKWLIRRGYKNYYGGRWGKLLE